MKKILTALALSFSLMCSAQTVIPEPPATGSICAPDNPVDVRTGTIVNGDSWFYWWCRNTTNVWPVYVVYTRTELLEKVWFSANVYAAAPMKSFLAINDWAREVLVGGIPTGKEAAVAAMQQSIASDPNRPLPGTITASKWIPEIWVVTPNGANSFRRTSLVTNGVVQAYGSGTQLVRIGRICDNRLPSFPLGSTTKYLPLIDNTPTTITNEVISCIRIQ